jgi:HD-GYP domain-containing protein (c-di-GMP phosphodiesterase class II)
MDKIMRKIKRNLENLISIPFDPSDEGSNRANVISGLIALGSIITLAYLIPAIPSRGLFSVQVIGGVLMIGFLLYLRFAVLRRHSEVITIVMLISSWLFVAYILLFLENGLRAPAYSLIMVYMIVFAGVLHSRKAANIVTVVTLLTSAAVAAGEMSGFYLTEPKIPDIRWVVIGQVIIFSGVTFLLNRTLGNLLKSIKLYRDESQVRHRAELDVRRLHEELEVAYETTLAGWAQALELRDKETEGHSQRVTGLCIKLGQVLGMSEVDIKNLRYGALLHDISKMGIPDEVLYKTGPLTPEERQIVERHPQIAHDLLMNIDFLKGSIGIPFSHHEHWDGSGYPQRLKGGNIPISARIFTIVDNWDALLNDRPYRKAWNKEKVVNYIREQRGKIFDPTVVDIFLDQVVPQS